VDDPSAVDVVRRLYFAFADRDLDAVTDCFAEDAVWTLPPVTIRPRCGH
jgi:ketosteroid isomerase-like protein